VETGNVVTECMLVQSCFNSDVYTHWTWERNW
jgi:hypothetical protein